MKFLPLLDPDKEIPNLRGHLPLVLSLNNVPLNKFDNNNHNNNSLHSFNNNHNNPNNRNELLLPALILLCSIV